MTQREDLLAGARKCLVEKGYHRTTARNIAAASGAHLASIGYHYGSKDALMTWATIQASGEWGNAIDEAVRAADAASPADRVQTCVDELAAVTAAQREVLVASIQAYAQAEFDEKIRTSLAEATADARTSLAAMVLGCDAKAIDPRTAETLGAVVHALVVGLSVQALVAPESLPNGADVAASLRTITDG